MEAAMRLLLGTAVQHTLQGTGPVQAIGLCGGPSPHAGTHRSSPSTMRVDEGGALPSGRVVLSRTVWRYYDPLRLPGGRLPLPGLAGYRQALLPEPRRLGPPRASPVPTTTFRPFHTPYAGGFLGTRSRLPGAVHGLRHRNTGSAPSWPLARGILTTLPASPHASAR